MDAEIKPSKVLPIKKSSRNSKSASFLETGFDKSSKTSCEFTLERIYQTDLTRFCPKKFFYIFIMTENDDQSGLFLNNLVTISKTYEEVSSLSFISRDDVFALLDTTDTYSFPNQLKPLLLNVIESVNGQSTEDISPILEVQLLKLKLIQVMYQQYVNQVKRNEKEKNLEALLSTLSKECKKKQKKDEIIKEDDSKNKNPLKEDIKNVKKIKKDDKTKDAGKDEEVDYTSFPVDKDGISYEENIFDYIWFYCIKGYYNADIIRNLIDQVNVPICAIVKFSSSGGNTLSRSNILKSFWEHIEQYFFGNTSIYKSLENTILMEFSPSKIGTEILLVALEELVFMLRRIVNVKLTYLKYLRYLKINRIQYSYAVARLECLQQYDKSLRYIPSECINTELVLDAILKEVSFKLDSKDISGTSSQRSLIMARPSNKSVHCINLLHDFDAFANAKRNESNLGSINSETFLVHDNDVLTKTLKSYKYIGAKIANTILNLVTCMPVIRGLNDYVDNANEDICHLHDVNPSTDLQLASDATVDHFMYIFLLNTFSSKIPLPKPALYYELSSNLTTFDVSEFWNMIQPKCNEKINASDEHNIYDISMVNFRWKENLSKNLLLQEVYAASKEYLYMDRKYSPETDNFLVVFSDKLDYFGINTKMIDVVVRTPVCFRDFCRYVLVEEASWLQKNESKISESSFKIVFDENCPGAQKVKKQLPQFQEYAYLLDGNIIENIDTEQQIVETNNIDHENRLQGISEVFTELEKFNSNVNILQECENVSEDKQLIAYDFGTNLFKVTGKITTFYSHDNVKVTVDNTGFLQFPEKCTFNVISDGNTLTVHSKESQSLSMEPYVATLNLANDTRISFIIKKHKAETEECYEAIDNSIFSSESQETDLHLHNLSNMPVIEESSEQNSIHETGPEINDPQVVHCVDEDYFDEIFEGKALDELSVNENQDDLLESLLNAKENNGIIYKVNMKSHFLKRKNTSLTVPMENAFKNLISFDNIGYKAPKPHQIYTKRFEIIHDNKSDMDIKNSIDFRVCLPNGLFIRPHSCVVDKNALVIKQEYVDEKPQVSAVQHEEFRLFNSQGLVLIKKVDGTVTILKANGDMIDFEKPSDDSGETSTVRPCHCSTLEDLRKKLNKLLKDQENSSFTTSRRGHITSKQNHIFDSKVLGVLEQFNVPYFKISLTKFDGKRIKIQGDKITQKQLFHLTSQEDFFSGEIFSERDDDFRSTFDKYGSQKNMFPDGTIISNSVDVNDKLIDDFVYVELSYKYEHPCYATVKYNFDKTVEIMLNKEVSIIEHADQVGFMVNMNKGLSTYVNTETISFQKMCLECAGLFQADFNIEPFRSGSWNPAAEFMHVKDSYAKHFYSDFLGNCSRNDDFIKGNANSMKCNHITKTNYKQVFIINKDYTGDRLCTNDSVKTKTNEMEIRPDSSVNTYNMIANEHATIVDCREKVYVRYSDRFYNNSIHQKPDHSKKLLSPQRELYTTFIVFQKMFQSADEIAKHISNMNTICENRTFNNLDTSSIYNNMSALSKAIEAYYENYQQELLTEKEELNKQIKAHAEDFEKRKRPLRCNCIKEKLTMQEKMLRWRRECNEYRIKIRNNDIPVYFRSDFCQMEK